MPRTKATPKQARIPRHAPLLYVPKGKAAPYCSGLALNPFLTCNVGCSYCYNRRAPGFVRTPAEAPRFRCGSRMELTKTLAREIGEWTMDKQTFDRPTVHMSFLGDIYQSDNDHVADDIILLLTGARFPVQVLTKMYPDRYNWAALIVGKVKFGVTLTAMKNISDWEPRAAMPVERLSALGLAQGYDLKTWVSIEPMRSRQDAIDILISIKERELRPDPIWIGPLNYHARGYDWDVEKKNLKEVVARLGLEHVQFKDEAH